MRSRSEFEGWSTPEVERFFYHWADPRDQRRVVKIAPGENAVHGTTCLREGYICVGWDGGDLREFESKESFRSRFDKEYGRHFTTTTPTIGKKANEVWTLSELEPGDLVVANKGTSQILAIGKVVEPAYTWKPDREEFRHTVQVEWDTSYAKTIRRRIGGRSSLAPVPAALYHTIVGEKAARFRHLSIRSCGTSLKHSNGRGR